MKLKVKKQEEITYTYDIDFKTIPEAIEVLKELQKAYGKEAKIQLSTSGYDSPELYVIYEREETDEEYEQRLENEKIKAKQQADQLKKRQKKMLEQREKDLKELERLKAIYEK